MAKFGQNTPDWTLDSLISCLEAILEDEEEIQERRYSKKRGQNIEYMESALKILNKCCE